MNISDLQARQGSVEVIGEITEVGEVREFEKFGKTGRVANAVLKDETGSIKLTLWNEQIDNFKEGDKVRIENGYVNEWQGEKQLTTGKFGKMEKIEMTGSPEESKDKKKDSEVAEENKPEEPKTSAPDEDIKVEEEQI